MFLAPAAWVATEFLRGFLFGGFPWVPLGNSQVTVLPVAQLASVLGVYGVSGARRVRQRVDCVCDCSRPADARIAAIRRGSRGAGARSARGARVRDR